MRPLTASIPKPLLPVADKPFLRHTLDALQGAGVTHVTVLVGWQGHRIREFFGDGADLGLRLEYAEQERRLGTAHAVGLAEGRVGDPFLCLNGDIVITEASIRGLLAFCERVGPPVVAVAEVPNPEAFGVVAMEGDRVVRLEEKPSRPASNLINAGVYVFGDDVFDRIRATPRSPRGEYEITDTLRLLIDEGRLRGYRLPDPWIDVGRPWDLLAANAILLRDLTPEVKGQVSDDATLDGPVRIGEGTRILPGAYIKGPTIVGANCEIGPNCLIRPSTTIGNGCKVGNACEVKNAILMDGTHVPHHNYVGDSILGERCNLGSGTKIANLRLDEGTVKVAVKGKAVDTGRRKLGAILGDDVKTGINASIDVGTVIGEGTFIGPGAVVRGVVAPRSRIF
jgi:bifunctional UDP-N-acetylglucosamine pyrophosphorylase/glucosamine-1-phosphate N-acetyltransferase